MPPIVRVILIVLGILAIVVGVIYVVEPIHSLPTFFPGYAAHLRRHHKDRGYAGIVLGVILLIIAAIPRRRRGRRLSPDY